MDRIVRAEVHIGRVGCTGRIASSVRPSKKDCLPDKRVCSVGGEDECIGRRARGVSRLKGEI